MGNKKKTALDNKKKTTLNNKKNTALGVPVKIGIGLLVLFLLLDIVFLSLLVKERKRTRELVKAVKETNEKVGRLREALKKSGAPMPAEVTAEKKAPPAKPVQVAQTRPEAAPAKPSSPAPEKVSPSVPAKAAPPVPATPAPQKAAPVAQAPAKVTPPAKPAAPPAKPPVEVAQAKPEAAPAKAVPAAPIPSKTAPPATAPAKPAGPVEEAKKAATPPLERAVKLNIPANSTPAPFLVADQGEYLLICEKDARALHVFKYGSGKFSLVKSYPCILGANNGDKKKKGDFATPKGVYFVVRYTPGNKLPGDYGTGAFVLNYPNLVDRKEGKNGNGIWLHGHNDKKSLTDLLNTKGCIVVTNDVLKELTSVIRPQGTPIAIVDTLQFSDHQKWQAASDEIKSFVSSWRHAWESLNTKKYLSFYAPDFLNNEGMSFEAFKKHKEKVNASKKSIRVKTEHMAALIAQDRDGKLAVVRFDQRYQSSNFKSDSKKLLYLRKGKQGWQIIGESVF